MFLPLTGSGILFVPGGRLQRPGTAKWAGQSHFLRFRIQNPLMSGLIISVSGLRGIVGETLTPLVASRFVAAFASQLPDGKIIVGRDGRQTGPMLCDAILAALCACGREVIYADVAATPTIGVLVKTLSAAGAVQVSASHNPPPYNGIKLFGSDGRVIDAEKGGLVRQAYDDQVERWCAYDQLGTRQSIDDAHQPHLESVLATVDAEQIRSKHYRVLLDSNHGAGGILGKRLLESLGCEVVLVGGTPDGQFAHVPEPTAANLVGIAERVKQENCVVGFCQDPDADRLALIDADGRYVGEECTLALCVQRAMLNEATRGPVVINGATSSMSERLVGASGHRCYRSAVGEANVANKMLAVEATYGGEGNGGPIDPRVGYVRDSFVGMAQVLELMSTTEKTLAQLVDALPKFAIHKDKASMDTAELPALFEKLRSHFPDATADDGDGLRLAWPDRWLLVRGSNTEPIVRFIAEAESLESAKQLCDDAQKLI